MALTSLRSLRHLVVAHEEKEEKDKEELGPPLLRGEGAFVVITPLSFSPGDALGAMLQGIEKTKRARAAERRPFSEANFGTRGPDQTRWQKLFWRKRLALRPRPR